LLANFTAAIIFGFAFLFIKTGMQVVEFDSIKFLAFRFTLGFLVLTILLAAGFRKVNYKGKPLYLLLLCGMFNPLTSQVLETTATTYAPTSQIAVFNSMIPVLVVLLSIPINRELPTRRQVFFMTIGVSGIMLINLVGGQMEGSSTLGLILMLGTVTSISVQRILIRRASQYFTPFETIYIGSGMGALGFSITTLLRHSAEGRLNSFFDGLWTLDFIIPILYMGIISSVIAFLCLTYAAGNLPIAVSSSTSMLASVISVLVGIFILNEVFRPIDIIGASITFLGILGMSLSYNAALSNRFRKAK
jgi:drug/metabolite transporter (DMT)-like permease